MKILVVDDHALVREALRGVLKELQPNADVLEAASGGDALSLVEAYSDIRLLVLDLNLPDRDGVGVLIQLRAKRPSMSIVVVSAHDDHHKVRTTLREGAVGFIPKSATRDVLVGAFRLIFAGGIYIPPEALGPEDDARAAALPTNNMGLTQRQLEVLALMMQGKSNKVICRKLNLAEATVKNHATAIFRVLKVSNRTEAVIAAGALGLELPQIGAL